MKKIELSRGEFAIVDDGDYSYLSQFNWYITTKGYAVRKQNDGNGRRYEVFMHRELLDCPKGKFVDHINRNKIDNRRGNLRIATNRQNGINRGLFPNNTSGYKGVSFCRNSKKWVANLNSGGTMIHLGYYDNKEDAAKAYNLKAEELYGEFAFLNDVHHEGFKLSTKTKTSRYKGVSKTKGRNKWNVHLVADRKTINLGSFDDENDAARMYNFWATDLLGEKAKLNKIQEAVW